MDAIAPYLFFWNDWVVLPAALAASGVGYWRLRKVSLAVLTAGIALVVIAKGLHSAYPEPLHPVYVAGLVVGIAGFVAAVGGFGCFIWKHAEGRRMQPNSALLTDAFSSLRRACGAAKRER